MKIKKMFQGTIPENKILNVDSNSKTDVYSCDFVNKKMGIEHLVGIYPIISVPFSGNSTGDIEVGQAYGFKTKLLEMCPLKDGYKRIWKAVIVGNTGNNMVKVFLSGSQLAEIKVWGASSNQSTMVNTYDVTEQINNISQGNATIKINNTYSGSSSNFYYINKLDIYAYDVLEEITE